LKFEWQSTNAPYYNFYSIHNKMNGLVLDSAGYTSNNGAWIIQWKSIGEKNQQWVFVRQF
jgi:hypothetical protein